jgi:hypothetical protein
MIEHNGQATTSSERVLGQSVSRFGSDILTLMELQAELLQLDLKEWAAGFIKSMIALATGLVILLASLPVLLMSLGYYINGSTSLSLGSSMLIAAAVGVVIALCLAGLGVWLMKRDKGVLHRCSSELKHNVRWLKQVLSRPSAAARAE